MEPINIVNSVITPLDRKNVDTDQIISKEFLKRIERTGFGQFLFYHWRFDAQGNEIPDFILNKPEFKNSKILVAQDNFGCGSSREHAPWAILDYGFNVVIAPSFADIFHNNCFKNGILPIKLTEAECDEILAKSLAKPYMMEVNLEAQTVTGEDGNIYKFNIDSYYKETLLNGWDEIALTIKYEEQIAAYEAKRIAF
ncbi:3-isopropylmalate dehydratase small subunit [Lysinibacillus pakistanensis]|uniref:3-isopropylmalate dehydratase small subunit n=1 Tax=Lysinibacillus pakistanensis TaxID=759811 RepID=A0AAX3WPF6_9BACI|nr:3-isopropylmalate dehydratase small subunit [Lysinibacillus pakistanensis]MDM5234048.1 3-isopropylmalate dehydratase small subunit [Lysinibacillus pakistanensis]WHY44650.1 3-isopropylmalate dehydratase small subunit [Lysinibacillus pakistanensis]WHY49656.1 3-isopropylmalate dehydratase small subunit [Lysinibacillus pakistanensis]